MQAIRPLQTQQRAVAGSYRVDGARSNGPAALDGKCSDGDESESLDAIRSSVAAAGIWEQGRVRHAKRPRFRLPW